MIEESVLKRKISDRRDSTIASIIEEIQENKIVLPEFQRDYVWSMDKVQKLLTSIISGRIVGGVLVWESNVEITSKTMIETLEFRSRHEKFLYLLDGQQRITSIFHAINGKAYKKNDFSKLLIDLDADILENLIILQGRETKDKRTLPFKDIFSQESLEQHDALISWGEGSTLRAIANRIMEYSISIFTLKTDDIEEAISQFNALNSGGKNMTVSEIVLSKIYSPDFKLKEQIEKLLGETADYKLHEKVVLDTLAFCIKGNMSGTSMIQLEFEEVKENWNAFQKALKATTDYLSTIGFYELSTLPYKNNFILICRLFFENNYTHLDSIQHENCQRYILHSGIIRRYRVSSTSYTIHDYNKLKAVINKDVHMAFQLPYIDNGFIYDGGNNFSSKFDGFTKSILWMFRMETPLSFKNNTVLKIERPSNSKRYCKNLHHIFPLNYLKGMKTKYPADHLVNICYVESGINQTEISDKKPSAYLKEFFLQNKNVNLACESSLIPYNVAIEDDYDKFFDIRHKAIEVMIEEYFPELSKVKS